MKRGHFQFLCGLSSLALLLVGACGGGGGGGAGGGPAPVVYAGNTNPALIGPANASKLTANLLGSGDSAGAIAGISIAGDGAIGPPDMGFLGNARRLRHAFREAASRAGTSGRTPSPLSGFALNETDPCDGGNGTESTFGTLDDVTLTGTVTVLFANCLRGDMTLSGQGELRIDEFDFMTLLPTDFTMSFARLALRAAGLSLDTSGSVRIQLDLVAGSETTTVNLVDLDNLSGRMTQSSNLVIATVADDVFAPTLFSETVSGRMFDSQHGYVDVTTAVSLVLGSAAQSRPQSGELVLTGGGGGTIRVKAWNATLVQLDLDSNGDGAVENAARLKWTDLSGPVGADLADNDGDGMHNSWEIAVGLNQNDPADAALDDDGDDYGNLAEYLGGGDPHDAASLPSMLVGSVLPFASDVTTADSNTERPGRSALVSDGTNYLLVSCRDSGPATGVFGVRISESGEVLGDFLISAEACPVHSAAAFDGTNYLVTLARGGQIFGIRVTPGGAVLDAAGGFPISTAGSNFFPAVGFDGTNYLVAWAKFVDNSQYEIYGARVTPAGGALGEFPVFTAPGEQLQPVLAFDGTNYLVVWRDTRSGSGPSTDTDLYGTRVSPSGAVLDPAGIAIATAPGVQEPGGIAFDGTNYLVVWNQIPTLGTFPPPGGVILGRRVSPAGTLLDGASGSDGIAIATGPFANHSSSVAFAGSSYVVTWAVGSFPNNPPAGIFAARVSKNGVRIDGAPTDLGLAVGRPPVSTPTRYVHPVVASHGQSGLISWVDNIELGGAHKDVLGVPLFVP